MSKKSNGFFSKIFSIVAFILLGLLIVYMYITKGNIESLVNDKLPDEVPSSDISSAEVLVSEPKENKVIQEVKKDEIAPSLQNVQIKEVNESKVVLTPQKSTLKVTQSSKQVKEKPQTKSTKSVSTTIIELPKVPEVPKVITVGGSTYKPRERRHNSLIAPLNMDNPIYVKPHKEKKQTTVQKPKSEEKVKVVASSEKKTDTKKESTTQDSKVKNDSSIGENKNGRVPSYIRGDLISTKEAIKNIKEMGCKVLSVNSLDKNKNLTSIVFTNDSLEKYSNKEDRGFMASLRLLIDKKNNQITISNPIYFTRAFMQDDYDEKVPKEILAKIRSTFSNLKNSKENLKYTLLPKYHFMVSMPYYEDMSIVGESDSSEKLLKKIKSKDDGAHIVFTQVLSKDRILVGVKLGSEIESFIDKTGAKNSLLLPYPVLLEKGEAKILDPKYYIAISYPMLKMSQFMKISDVPGEIEDRCEKLFK
jgi:hypothetical protein